MKKLEASEPTPDMTTEEGNKIIAGFMGMKFVPDSEDIHGGEWLPVTKHSNWCFEGAPPFNSSWSWLMPVVKKIQQLEIRQFHKKKPIMNALMDVEIDSLYQAVTVFILWHNTTTPNTK